MSRRLTCLVLLLVPLLAVLAAVLLFYQWETRELGGAVRDAETGAPLQDAVLVAGDLRVTTDAHGRYALPLPRGEVTLTAEADGYVPAVHRLRGDDLFSYHFAIDFVLTPNQLVGRVRDAETQQPVADARLQLGSTLVTANAQGQFEARGFKTGTPLAVHATGYETATLRVERQTNLEVLLVPCTVTVTVTDLANQPLANAQVQTAGVTAVSDANGRAVLRRVGPGALMRISAAGHETGSAFLTGREVRVALRPSTLDGTVTDAATGRPISNTLVYVGSAFVATNAQGAFHLDNVPAKATVSFHAPGYRKTDVAAPDGRRLDVKLTRFAVKGIRILFGSTPESLRANIDLVAKTELNAIIVDVKSEKGRIAWDSQVPLAREIEAAYLKGINLAEVIERCRALKIYCIARIPVFQDTLLATARPALGLKYPNGTVFFEDNGSGWTDAGNSQVWDYNLALAKEVAALGFDEIQFDYIRFPGGAAGLYTGVRATPEGRIGAIAGFLARAQKELRPTGVFVSADVFGLTTATDEDQYTGQRLRDLGQYVDYISPMVYPDVWVDAGFLLSNGLGIRNCTEAVRCPYDVVLQSTKRAAGKTTTIIRPWLQAYAGRGNFGVAQYKQQKKAAEDAGINGWMFWSGTGTYDAATFGPPE